jgi:hypothetical protein
MHSALLMDEYDHCNATLSNSFLEERKMPLCAIIINSTKYCDKAQ